MKNVQVKWRTWGKGGPPAPIKLSIPGWAGDHHSHETGSTPQPWHCVPFIEGSTYGLELIYPFETETRVINDDGKILFDGDFSKECMWEGSFVTPFSNFAPGHFGFTSSLDIEVPEEHVVRLEPHPRFFTDTTGHCPIAVPGHIQPWWCRIFFVVFKAPSVGQMHIFRKNEPYAQILVVPKKVNYEIKKMTDEEIIERKTIETLIDKNRTLIAKHSWIDNAGNHFDDKYKQMQKVFNKSGKDGLNKFLCSIHENKNKVKKIGRYVKKCDHSE